MVCWLTLPAESPVLAKYERVYMGGRRKSDGNSRRK